MWLSSAQNPFFDLSNPPGCRRSVWKWETLSAPIPLECKGVERGDSRAPGSRRGSAVEEVQVSDRVHRTRSRSVARLDRVLLRSGRCLQHEPFDRRADS